MLEQPEQRLAHAAQLTSVVRPTLSAQKPTRRRVDDDRAVKGRHLPPAEYSRTGSDTLDDDDTPARGLAGAGARLIVLACTIGEERELTWLHAAARGAQRRRSGRLGADG